MQESNPCLLSPALAGRFFATSFFFKALIHNVSEFTGPNMTDLQLPTTATLNQDLGRVHSRYCKPKNWLRVIILFKHLFQKSGPAPRR